MFSFPCFVFYGIFDFCQEDDVADFEDSDDDDERSLADNDDDDDERSLAENDDDDDDDENFEDEPIEWIQRFS